MAKILEKFVQGSPEWLEQRIGKMTGTRSGKLHQGRPSEVMREMVREYIKAPSEFVPNEHTERGKNFESVARFQYLDETGYTMEENSLFFQVHDDYDWLGVSPDGIAINKDSQRIGIEIKCPVRFYLNSSGKQDLNQPYPKGRNNYYGQVQHFMEICDLDSCDYIEYVEGEIRYQNIKRDREYWKQHLPKIEGFMEDYWATTKDPDRRSEYGEEKDLTISDTRLERLIEISIVKNSLIEEEKELKKQLVDEKLTTSAYHGLKSPCGYRLYKAFRSGSINYKRIFETYENQITSFFYEDKLNLDSFRNNGSESITLAPPKK